MNTLELSDIDEIRDAAISLGFAEAREDLLAGISKEFTGIMRKSNVPAGQLMQDLARLNSAGVITDGTAPFRRWLQNAIVLAGRSEKEEAVFKSKLLLVEDRLVERLGAKAVGAALRSLSIPEAQRTAKSANLGSDTRDAVDLALRAARADRVDATILAALAQKLDDALRTLAAKRGLVPDADEALQRMLRGKPAPLDPRDWRRRLAELEGYVCRVEIHLKDKWVANGTGFLIAPDVVLTNRHVIRDVIGTEGVRVRCRFDYYAIGGGQVISEGTVFDAVESDWLLADAPHSPFDTNKAAANEERDPAHLDFAALKLAKEVGRLTIEGNDPATHGRLRGWLPLPAVDSIVTADVAAPVLILEHPDGEPIKLAIGNMLESPHTRVRYDCTTEGGSSGSPCFNAKLELIALHHAGDPKVAELAQYNQGIPILAIAKALSDRVARILPPATP